MEAHAVIHWGMQRLRDMAQGARPCGRCVWLWLSATATARCAPPVAQLRRCLRCLLYLFGARCPVHCGRRAQARRWARRSHLLQCRDTVGRWRHVCCVPLCCEAAMCVPSCLPVMPPLWHTSHGALSEGVTCS